MCGRHFAVLSCSDATDIVQAGELNDVVCLLQLVTYSCFFIRTYDRLGIENELMASSLLTDELQWVDLVF
jgi:hypothetical protein